MARAWGERPDRGSQPGRGAPSTASGQPIQIAGAGEPEFAAEYGWLCAGRRPGRRGCEWDAFLLALTAELRRRSPSRDQNDKKLHAGHQEAVLAQGCRTRGMDDRGRRPRSKHLWRSARFLPELFVSLSRRDLTGT